MNKVAIFSASPYDPNVDKGYYKDFAPASVDTLQELGEMMYTHSLSGYLYGEELSKTDGGLLVHYRKAKDNICGNGNIIFIDIDNKVKIHNGFDEDGKPLYKFEKAEGEDFVSLDKLRSALKKLGAPTVITHSKSSKLQHPKFHVAVITTDNGEADNFQEHYYGFIELLGIGAKGLDLIMKSAVQNLTPAYLHPERFIEVIEGNPLPFTSLMPSEAFRTSLPSNGTGLNGTHSITVANYDELIIRRQNEGNFIEQWEIPSIVFEAEKNGANNGKIRTQCHHGKAHDGRYDSGFIRFHENNMAIYSHCTVCGDKVELWRADYAEEFDDLGELSNQKNRLILASELVKNVKPLQWVINGMIPKNGLIEIFGASGSYKSFITLDMLFCIASGKPYHGTEVDQSAVVYVAAEGAHGVQSRLIALSKHYDCDLEKLPFYILPMPVDLSDEREIKKFAEDIERVGVVGITVFDTLHRNSGATDENSSQDFAKILSGIDKHLMSVSNVVGWVHHTGVSDSSRGRGTSSRFASCDTVIQVERMRESQTAQISCKKQKDGQEFSTMAFKLINIPVGMYEDEVEMTSLVPTLTEIKHSVKPKIKETHIELLQCLRSVIGENGVELSDEFKDKYSYSEGSWVPMSAWRTEAFKIITSSGDTDPKKSNEAKKRAFLRYRKDLKDEGIIIEFNDHVAIIEDCVINEPDI